MEEFLQRCFHIPVGVAIAVHVLGTWYQGTQEGSDKNIGGTRVLGAKVHGVGMHIYPGAGWPKWERHLLALPPNREVQGSSPGHVDYHAKSVRDYILRPELSG
jgi:hypothetical protein